jgi:hypothetical protein
VASSHQGSAQDRPAAPGVQPAGKWMARLGIGLISHVFVRTGHMGLVVFGCGCWLLIAGRHSRWRHMRLGADLWQDGDQLCGANSSSPKSQSRQSLCASSAGIAQAMAASPLKPADDLVGGGGLQLSIPKLAAGSEVRPRK